MSDEDTALTPERWQKIEKLFGEASERSSADRVAFLDGACAGDTDLRLEVERLLASHDRGQDFIERPALEVAASVIAEERAQAVRGKVIGRYRILELIGTGGMGEVYLAEDAALGRKVALKVLLPAYAEKDRDSLRRFRQEGRAASALSHPNIAHIYEIGEADGANFIAMEYVEGQLLDARINGRPLDSAEIVDIGIQVADALDEAHAKGITHRDIKSANIIIASRGRVKVLDFGLAKTADLTEQTAENKGAQIQTRPGVVLGTIAYMSPEQALGRRVDPRTDIFSLGVVLYEMATGRLPFSGESVTETIDKIAHAQPDAMGRFNYDLPEELERIVKKALRKSRDERYQTARDLLVDLKNLRRELEFATQAQHMAPEAEGSASKVRSMPEDTGATSARETQAAAAHATSSAEYIVGEIKRHKLGVALTAVMLVGAIVVIPFLLKRYLWTEQPVTRSTGKTMKSKRLLNSATGGKAGNTSISPDGKFVVYKDDEVDRRQGLWIRQVATGVSRQIVAPEEVQFAGTTFSRDGNVIYYVVLGTKYPSGALFQVPVIGGNAKQLLVNISGPITQSPNGKQISYAYQTRLMIANVDGTAARPLATILGIGLLTPPGPAWSPDGKVVAFGSRRSDGPYASVFTVDVAKGEVKQVTNHEWSSVRRLLWFGDGSGLVLLASDPEQDFSQVWELSFPSGAVRRITNDLNGHGHVSLGLTADSTTMVTQQEDDICQVWLMAFGDASNARQLTFGEGQTDGRFGVAWSPNGSLIYSARVTTGWNLSHIKTDGTQQETITANAYRDEYPAVTPDGQTIIFQSTRGTGIYHLWRMDLKGGQLKQLTAGENAEDNTARVSPDGRWVLYSSHTAGQGRIWKVPIDGGEPVRLTDYQSKSPDVSPDGKFIACVFLDGATQPTRWRVAIIPFAGGPPVKTIDLPPTADISRSTFGTRSATYVRWLPGARALAYVDLKNGVSNLWSQPIDGGPPTQLTNFPSGQIFNFELSPDGKQIACARGTRTSDVILITDFR